MKHLNNAVRAVRTRLVFGFFLALILAVSFSAVTASASVKYNNSFKKKNRYVVTCNHHYDNTYNTLAKCDTPKEARERIRKEPLGTRGQWYVWDSKEKKIVWPDLSTDKKKISKIVQWSVAVGKDARHGYDTEGERFSNGCDLKWKRWGKCGDYGCSPLVETPFELFGFFNMRTFAWNHHLTYYTSDRLGPLRGFNANNIVPVLRKSKKFKELTSDYMRRGKSMLQPGDIIVNSNQTHCAIVVTDHRIVEGNLNENGLEFQRSKPGDQRGGYELSISHYSNPSFYFYRQIYYVFRPKTGR